MPSSTENAHLRAELGSLRTILAQMPEEDVFGRASLEARLDEVERELVRASEVPASRLAYIDLLFEGDPVRGMWGLDAEFASEALSRYEMILDRLNFSPSDRDAPRRARGRPKLYLTELPRGSFGLRLQELDTNLPLFPTHLAELVDTANDLVVASVAGDEQFADAMAGIDPAVKDSVRGFVSVLAQHGAALKIRTPRAERAIERERIPEAVVRLAQTDIDEEELNVEGMLLGALPEARRFELMRLSDQQVIRGAIVREHNRDAILAWEKALVGKRCVATVRRTRATRQGKQTERFTLLALQKA